MNEEQLRPFLRHAGGNKLMGIAIALVCFGIASLGWLDRTAGMGIKLGLAIPFGLIGAVLLFVVFRPASRHAAIVTLRERLHEIVWVYPLSQSVNGVPSQTFLNFGLLDGSSTALAIGAKTDPKPLMDLLRSSLPNATFGYSEELQKRFKQSPVSLRG